MPEERQEQIISLLSQNTKLLVPDLCDYFHVSPATIRSDLRELAAKGRLKRTHGGAIPINKTIYEPTNADKKIYNTPEKQALAALAAQLVEDGDKQLLLMQEPLVMELAKNLVGKEELTIVVNDLNIAVFLEQNTFSNIIVLGGNLRKGQQCTVGPITLSALTSLNVDKVFLATNAFTPEKGFMTPDINQAEAKRQCCRNIQNELSSSTAVNRKISFC